MRRAVVLAALVLAGVPASPAPATELNVIPHGQHAVRRGVGHAPGMLPAERPGAHVRPAHAAAGATSPTRSSSPAPTAAGYFKSARLLAPDDPSLITDETVSADGLTARIRRDAYGVPHVYSDTDAGVIFGAGYVDGRRPQPGARPGARQRHRRRDRPPGRAGDPAGARALQLPADREGPPGGHARSRTRALQAAGPDGRQVLRDIDTYLVGINQWYAQNRPEDAAVRPRGHLRAQRDQGAVPRRGRRAGGRERAVPRRGARPARQAARATASTRTCASATIPETSITTAALGAAPDERLGAEAEGPRADRAGQLPVRGREAAGAGACGCGDGRARPKASNVLLVNGARSATGTPMMVGGPQIGYNYPGLTMEIGLYGPTLRARGATSAPFPGYMLIGRGQELRVDAHLGRR